MGRLKSFTTIVGKVKQAVVNVLTTNAVLLGSYLLCKTSHKNHNIKLLPLMEVTTLRFINLQSNKL